MFPFGRADRLCIHLYGFFELPAMIRGLGRQRLNEDVDKAGRRGLRAQVG